MESSGHNWANISETICPTMLVFGKKASWMFFFQNILTNPIIPQIQFLWRNHFSTLVLCEGIQCLYVFVGSLCGVYISHMIQSKMITSNWFNSLCTTACSFSNKISLPEFVWREGVHRLWIHIAYSTQMEKSQDVKRVKIRQPQTVN